MTVYDVVVVGGGISGLYTAWRLANSTRLSIAVLEASSRFGGRFHTCIMPGDFPADFGAMRFVPSSHLLFSKLIQELGLPTGKLFEEGDSNSDPPKDYFKNRRVKGLDEMRKLYSVRDEDLPYFADAGFTWKLNMPANQNIFEAKVDGSDQLAKDMTRGQYISLASNSEVRMRAKSMLFPHIPNLAISQLRNNAFKQGREKNEMYHCVPGGMETIITALVKKLEQFSNVTLLTNACVDRIDEEGLFRVGLSSEESTGRIRTKKLVLACNARGMELISWNSPKKRTTRLQQLLRNVIRVPAMKLFLTYEASSWGAELNGNVSIETDLPIATVYTFGKKGQGGGYVTILAAMTFCEVEIFEGLNQPHYPRFVNKCGNVPKELQPSQLFVDYVQKQLQKVFGRESMPCPVCASCKIWSSDPIGAAGHIPNVGVDSYKLQFEAMKPFPDAEVYITGDTFAACTKTASFEGWSEGALLNCETMLQDYFNMPPFCTERVPPVKDTE